MQRRRLVVGLVAFPFMMMPLGAMAQSGSDLRTAVAMLNQYRAAYGLPALRGDGRLVQAAQQQADSMARLGAVSHDAGGPFASRMQAFGIRGLAAENLGHGYANLAAAMTGWQASSGHNANLLNPGVTRLGLATARGGDGRLFWALVLAQ